MQHSDEIMEYYEQEQPLNIKDFLFRVLSKWYWFAICGSIGLAFAWFQNRYAESIWQVDTTILVSEGSKNKGVDDLFQGLNIGKSVNMDNHIGLLKSYSLNRQTIDNLGWRTSWFGEGRFLDREYYDNEPYKVTEPEGFVNPSYIPVYVKAISEDRFLIKYDQKTNGNSVEVNQEGRLGVPFISPLFRFTLLKGNGKLESGKTCYFRFNNMNSINYTCCTI